MFPPSESGSGDGESARAVSVFPREMWQNGGGPADDVEAISDTGDDEEDDFYSMLSHTQDNDSIRSFLSNLDRDGHIPDLLPDDNSGSMRNAFAPERHLNTSPFSHFRPKAQGHSNFSSSFQSRLARSPGYDFMSTSEMELSFHRNSRIAHRIRSEAEERFHRYIDRLEAEQRRYEAFMVDYHDSDEEGSESTKEVEQQEEEDERPLTPIHETTEPPSPTDTITEPYMPFNNELALERCDPKRAAALRRNITPMNLTPERARYPPSMRSVWPSPSPARISAGRLWVAVPAADESGEVWEEAENVDASGVEGGKGRDVRHVSFMAQKKGLRGEKVDVKVGSKRKRGWSRCKKVLKRVLGLKK